MKYTVIAQPIPENLSRFYVALSDGTIAKQEPDGREIVASMQRAKIQDDGSVQWNEVCYCATPLAHERQTVYDFYFTDIHTELVDEYPELSGTPFWDTLEKAK
ncbi:MAG: hypothetical protein OQK24_05005 [Magnetovibrio sp.]|nr:hypothetical protein [Magnetovibrio sp.]